MQQGKTGTPIVYFVFDLLEVEGEPIIDLPLVERRKRLEKLLDKRNKTVRFSESFDDGPALLRAAKQQQLEGIMAKRLEVEVPARQAHARLAEDQAARPSGVRDRGLHAGQGRRRGRSDRWCSAPIAAVSSSTSATSAPVSRNKEIERLLKVLKPLERDKAPFREVPKMPRVRKGDVIWVEPKLVAEVEFVEWTHDGRLRAPAYKGLRDDKDARDDAHRRADGDRDPQGQARPQALEPRQAVLARGGHHEG